MFDGRQVPEVRAAGEISDDIVTVPLDPTRRILMLVYQPEGVAKFMEHNAFILPAEIHCRLIQGNAETVFPDVGPRAVRRIKGDPNLCVSGVVEIKLDIGMVRPFGGEILDDLLLLSGTADKADLQR